MKNCKLVLLTLFALAASVCVSQAQQLLVRIPFTDTGAGTTAASDTSSGGANVTLNLLNSSGVAADFHGTPGGGVSGLNVALDFSTNGDLTGSPGGNAQNGPIAVNTGSTALNFGVVTSYTATIWFKPLTPEFYGSGHYTRIFTLGANGTADKGAANSLGVFWNNSTSINCAFNAGLSLAGSSQPGAFTAGQWYFIAVTYDGVAGTATIYQGIDDGNGVTSVASQAFTGGVLSLTNASGSVLMVGNQVARGRPFDGWMNDFRFYTNAASANFVEDIRWSSLAPIVAAAPGNNQVTLTFPNLTNAASYTVYRSTSPAGPFNTSPTGGTGLTSPSFTDSTAVNGTTYYYEVTAVDAQGDATTSQNSQPVTVTPEPAPTTPQFTTATAANGSVSLSWTASTGTPAPISYNLAKSTVSGSEVLLTNISATSYVDTNVANGIEYFYTVTALSGLGEASVTSFETNSTPVGPPVAPANVHADAVGGGGIEVTWTAVPSATYTVLRATSSGGTYNQIVTGLTTNSYFDASGVLGDDYEVVAVGPGGPSPDSSSAASITPLLNVNFDSPNSAGGLAAGGDNPVPKAASGPGVIGSPGDIWNGENTLDLGTFTAGPLINADGSASPVTLNINENEGGSFDNNAPGYSGFSVFSWASLADENGDIGYPNSPYALLMACSINVNGGPTGDDASVVIGGLTPGTNYTLFVYSSGNTAGRISSFWINDGPTNTCTYDDKTTTLVSGVDYLQFACTADVNGDITINFGNTVDESDLNGFQLIAGSVAPATITSSASLNGLTLCTNTSLTFTATAGSVGGLPSTTISAFTNVVATSALGSLVTTSVTNVYTTNGTYASGAVVAGLGSSPATLQIPLPPNLKYSVSVTAVPASGPPLLAADTFDTFAPALVIETSDYNFNGGSWLETPVNGGVWLDYNQPDLAVEDTDFRKTGGEGGVQFGAGDIFYRDISLGTTPPGDAPYVTPAGADTFSEQKDAIATTGATIGVNDFPELGIGYASSGDWWNYTRTYGTSGYPVDSATNGTYNVWLYMAEGGAGGEQATLSSVPNPSIQSTNQTLTQLGQFGTGTFAENDWNGYEYVPLTDQYGNLLSTTIGSGTHTLQLQLGPGPNPNVGFLMLVPATPVLTPGLSYIYPNGQPFENTNVFNFTVTPNNGANILTSGIDLVLNGVDVSSGLTITPAAGNTWKVSYPLQLNTVYAAVISITNTSGLFSTFPYNFDTFNVNFYQWEAVDYDFSTNNGTAATGTATPPAQGGELYGGWISDLFIDNPVPTADITSTTASGPLGEEETNSYFGYPIDFTSGIDPFGAGAVAQQGVDINVTANGQGAGQYLYRIGDTVGNQTATDYLRPKFKAAQTKFNDPNIGLYNVGYIAAGNWFNYTRHYPAGSYNVWGRLANAAPYSLALGQVTAGVGTGTQTVTPLGTFTGTNGAGYQAWQWIPLEDANNNPVVVALNGQATTLRATAGTGLNMEYFMLVPVFTITATTSGGNINVSFPTQNTSSYQLLFKNSLTDPTWTPIGSPVSGNGSIESISQPITGTMRFYSVQVH